ncbi:unnamed protein product [Prorocentrum cordatum]|uniref:Uncharacterized protein n=1 Tax=Prorocentrum cordatum TaxID=2364126 RepID=A0ABN9Y7D8_9DINO|nr:unnamed protein product [Polarella glacialis]
MALPLASGAEVAAWGAASRRSSRPAEGGPAGCRGEAVEPERPVRAAEQWLGRRWSGEGTRLRADGRPTAAHSKVLLLPPAGLGIARTCAFFLGENHRGPSWTIEQ